MDVKKPQYIFPKAGYKKLIIKVSI